MPNYRRIHLPGGRVSHDRELLLRKAGGSLPYAYFGELLREEILETVEHPEDINEEITRLFEAVAR